MSKRPRLESANVAGMVANMMAPHSPASAPSSAMPTQRVIANSASAAIALGMRSANSDSPSRLTEAPCSQ